MTRLGLSPDTIDGDLATVEERAIALEVEAQGGIYLVGTDEAEFLNGSVNNDRLLGNSGDDSLFGFGGRDTLAGGAGNDLYFIDLETGSGSEVIDTEGESDDLLIVAQNSDIQTLADNFDSDVYLNLRANPAIYGDSAISLYLIPSQELLA